MDYKTFKYIYPPRPEYVISSDKLKDYEKDHLIQVKMNGSCVLIFIKGDEFRIFGRHKNENIRGFQLKINDLKVLNCGEENKWNVFVGEYMNKSQYGIDGKIWNHKFVIFDILVHNNNYLLGSTFEERTILLDKIFGTTEENEYLYRITDKIFRVKSFHDKFLERWKNIIKIGMLEGVVLKKKSQKLTVGLVEKNNMSHKCRKINNLYRF